MGLTAFSLLCSQASLPLCSLIGPKTPFEGTRGILPDCYARNIEVANTIIFQGANDIAHIGALAMTIIMIFHIRTKFTAVGRREILTFFYIYVLLTLCSLVLDAGVIPPATTAHLYCTSVQNGLISALCTSLLINGFVGFQIYEDGTTLSVWLLRSASAVMFGICFIVSLMTFKSWGALSPTNLVALFVVLYVLNLVFIVVYVFMQFFLVLRTLQDRWPLFHIMFGILAFVAGQVILYQFSSPICQKIAHYADGLFCATLANLFAVMMIYKFWDSITKEDLEFSVGLKQHAFETTGLLQPTEQVSGLVESHHQDDPDRKVEKPPVKRPDYAQVPTYEDIATYDYNHNDKSASPWRLSETEHYGMPAWAKSKSCVDERQYEVDNTDHHHPSRETRGRSRPWGWDRAPSKSRAGSNDDRLSPDSRSGSRARLTSSVYIQN